jgi:hypothetical protein
MNVPKSKDLVAGTNIVFIDGTTYKLKGRKKYDDGWWLEDGGGIADFVLDGDHWLPLGPWLFRDSK